MIEYDFKVIKAMDEDELSIKLSEYFHSGELGSRQMDFTLHSIQYKFIPDKREGYSGYYTALIIMQKEEE